MHNKLVVDRAVLEQALVALEAIYGDSCDAIHALRAALAQTQTPTQQRACVCSARSDTMIYTTLKRIRDRGPCADGWRKLLAHLGKTQADNEPVSLRTILESNGLDDALWCLRAVDGHEREMRLYAVWCARQVQHLLTDPRSLAALDVAERHAHGQATDDELAAAWAAARAAAGAAGEEARAARAAAWAAARATARAAEAAAWDAARAARAAAWDAAQAAAQAAEFRRVFCCAENVVEEGK